MPEPDSKEVLQMLKKVMEENNELKKQMLEKAQAVARDVPDYQSEVVTSVRSNPSHQRTVIKMVNDMLSLNEKDKTMNLSEKLEFEYNRKENLDQVLDVAARLLVRAKKRDITLKFPDENLGE